MTKKILALALAGTTAFSVFGSVLTASAASSVTPGSYDGAYKAYNVTAMGTVSGSAPNFAFGSPANLRVLFNFNGADQEVGAVSGEIYLFDYAERSTSTAALKTALKTAAGTEGVTGADLWNAFNAVYLTDITVNDSGVITAGTGVPVPETETAYGKASKARADAFTDLGKIYRDTVEQYTTTTKGDKNSAISEAELAEVYDEDDVRGYNLLALFNAIATKATADPASVKTSEAVYLVQAYNRIMTDYGVNASDTTSVMDEYDELYAELLNRVEGDYTADNWKKFQRALEDAEDLRADAETRADWKDALDQLKAARDVEAKAGKYADLQDALAALYTDGKTSSIKPNYYYYSVNRYVNADKVVYLFGDYQETNMYGRTGLTAAYQDAFVNTNDSTDRDSAYSKAYDVWAEAKRYGAKVAQSRIDNALAELESAIEALDPTSSAPNYQLVLLETALNNVAGYQESDYNTTSRKYKDYVAALEKAEEVMAKSNPSATEVITAFENLAAKAATLNDVAKSVPSSLSKSLREAVNDATVSLKEMSSKNGAQYVALQEALAIARDIQAGNWGADDITYNGNNPFKTKSTISDYETAIANLQAAMNGFNQVQGWYEEAGAWKYGEGNSVLNNGWNKIGNFWFFFNEDGTAKQNIWMNEGGKWYYFGNSCVAYSGWGMVDGSWYYFGKDCVMATGWIRPSHSYYYMDPASGKMVTGWAQIGGKWYYFSQASNNLGAMLTSTTTPDGYQVGADGAMI